ncbi:STAS domain-containing protein [Kribbella sp. NPDC059898]|uniref:STAS domain-containing protein n=1 Tax=Kribbella sp. NPDC059898 TaxID=3346995 RepID=UPI003663BDAD
MDDGRMLAIGVRDRATDVVVAVAGELDFGSTRELLAVAEPLARAGRSIVLDLVDLTFCDSTGLSALVRLHRQAEAAGGELRLARLRTQVEGPIVVTMLDRLLEICPEVPEAPAGAGAAGVDEPNARRADAP